MKQNFDTDEVFQAETKNQLRFGLINNTKLLHIILFVVGMGIIIAIAYSVTLFKVTNDYSQFMSNGIETILDGNIKVYSSRNEVVEGDYFKFGRGEFHPNKGGFTVVSLERYTDTPSFQIEETVSKNLTYQIEEESIVYDEKGRSELFEQERGKEMPDFFSEEFQAQQNSLIISRVYNNRTPIQEVYNNLYNEEIQKYHSETKYISNYIETIKLLPYRTSEFYYYDKEFIAVSDGSTNNVLATEDKSVKTHINSKGITDAKLNYITTLSVFTAKKDESAVKSTWLIYSSIGIILYISLVILFGRKKNKKK